MKKFFQNPLYLNEIKRSKIVSATSLKKIALSFPEATEEPHFEKTSFRVRKKIFATYNAETKQACLKLSSTDQDIFSLAAKDIIYPVKNKWGTQGWTMVETQKVDEDLFKDAILNAYCNVAPRALAGNVKIASR